MKYSDPLRKKAWITIRYRTLIKSTEVLAEGKKNIKGRIKEVPSWLESKMRVISALHIFFIYTSVLYTFMCHVTDFCLFISALRIPFSISCKANLVMMNSLYFVLSEIVYLFILEGQLSKFSFCPWHLTRCFSCKP